MARVLIKPTVCHLDVELAHPPGAAARKGLTVRQLKSYMIWVQSVVRQLGLYLPYQLKTDKIETFVRKDLVSHSYGVSVVKNSIAE